MGNRSSRTPATITMKLSIVFAAAVAAVATVNAQHPPGSPASFADDQTYSTSPFSSNFRSSMEVPAAPPTAADGLMQSNNYRMQASEGNSLKEDEDIQEATTRGTERVIPSSTKLTVAQLATMNIRCTSTDYCVNYAMENTGHNLTTYC